MRAMTARAAATAVAAGALLVPLAAPAHAVTTTATVVAYTADTNGDGLDELYTRAADGSGAPAKLFSTTNDISLPSLSPDGTKIAYLESNETATNTPYRLFVRTLNPLSAPVQLASGWFGGSVGWSADSANIVYSLLNPSTYAFGTYWKPATGGTPTLVAGTDTNYSEEPSFSPSGRQVALDAINDAGDYVGIDLVTLATGVRARLAGTTGGSDPVWSPDGQYIVFQKLVGCAVGLFRIPSGGGTPVQIRVVANRFLGSAEYTRDGAQLYWAEGPLDCGSHTAGDIWVGNADGTGAAKLAVTAVGEKSTSVTGGTAVTDTTAPDAPVVAEEGIVGATTARIGWGAPGDATEFYVFVKPSGDAPPASPADGTPAYHGSARSATVTGLTTGVTYDLYVFAVDASGNASAASAAHVARPTVPPVLATIPRVGVATTTASFPVKWTGTSSPYRLDSGEKVRNTTTNVWSTAPVFTTRMPSTELKSTTVTGAQGHSYYFRVRGSDGLGNATEWSATKAADVPMDDRWGGLSYGASWVAHASSSRYLGTYKTTTSATQVSSAKTYTSKFTVIGDRCATCGKFRVYVDGVLKATVDSYASTTKTRQVLYAGGSLGAIKPHSIKIVTLATSGRPRVTLDAIGLMR